MTYQLHIGDWIEQLRALPDESVNCCITSPPYWGLRDYGVAGQLGLEDTLAHYIRRLVEGFDQVRRVLRPDGTLWLNLGDAYCTKPNGSIGASTLDGSRRNTGEYRRAHGQWCRGRADGLKHKDLMGIPWRVAFALQDAGWFLRADIIWHKPNPMPESVKDRPGRAHEYLFLLSKCPRYFYDAEAVREPAKTGNHHRNVVGPRPTHVPGKDPHLGLWKTKDRSAGRNKRSVWTIHPKPFKGAHFATYPERLVEPCILAGCPRGGVVLDPFTGSGTTGAVALRLGRSFVGIELNPTYAAMADRRMAEAWAIGVQERIEGVA